MISYFSAVNGIIHFNFSSMKDSNNFEVIIIGGSYSGLSAAMALGRSLRNVLIIDTGQPCNKQTPHSHNFLTQDGRTPKEISTIAKEQVEKYDSVKFYEGRAIKGKRTESGFQIKTESGELFNAKKLIFATGIKDILPDIKGFSECWGISVIHCPYCHGYEVKNEVTGILANGDAAIHYSQLVSNLTKELTIFTNGKPSFTAEQIKTLENKGIKIIESEIASFEHNSGHIQSIQFKNGSKIPLKAIYARVPFIQHSDIPESLGCDLTDNGFIRVNELQQTNVSGVFACGDNSSFMRSVANAVATGNFVGAVTNKEFCEAQF